MTCRTGILSDAPATKDEFKIYEPIVEALIDTFINNEGGKAIGISGQWGSGKSTVVRLLEERVKTTEICVWEFDAWAHEGDPLRRTFLERLFERLSERHWITHDEFRDERESLSRRRKATNTTTMPRLTRIGSIATVLALLIPIGLVLFTRGVTANTDKSFPPSWWWVIGLVLSLSPLIGVGLVIAGSAFKQWRAKKNFALPDIGALLYRETVAVTESSTLETPEPTTVEFELVFLKLIERVLSGHPHRRLVLVVDNLDRVDRESARNVWSTLQTFLQRDARFRQPWIGNLWVIVPHSPDAIERLQPSTGNVAAETPGIDDGSAFLEKSIQVRIDLPLPVASDWREFLLRRLSEALPDHVSTDFESVYRVYGAMRRDATRPPTPREIKTFINELGALHRIRNHDFPLAHLAYYVLISRRFKRSRGTDDLSSALREGTIPSDTDATLVGPEIGGHLAAILFGTDVKTAQQLLFAEPIKSALTQGRGPAIAEMADAPGFWPALSDTLVKQIPEWRKVDPAALAQSAEALSKSGILEKAPDEIRRLVVRDVQHAVGSAASWPPVPHVAEGLVSAVRLDPQERLADTVYKSFSRHYASAQFEGMSRADTERWALSLFTLFEGLNSVGFAKIGSEGMTLSDPPASFAAFAEAWTSFDLTEKYWERFRTVNEPGFRGLVAERVVQGSFSVSTLNAVRLFGRKAAIGSWSDLASTVYQRMQPSNSVPLPEGEALVLCILELRSDPAVRDAITNVVENGLLAHQFATTTHDSKAFAVSIALTLIVKTDLLPSSRPGNAESWVQSMRNAVATASPLLVEYLEQLISRYDLIGYLWNAIPRADYARPLLFSVLETLAEKGQTEAQFPPEAIFSNWETVRGQKWLNALFESSGWTDHLATYLTTVDFLAARSDLYAQALQGANVNREGLQSHILKGLSQMADVEWFNETLTAGPAFLLASGAQGNAPFELSFKYRDGLVNLAKGLINASVAPTPAMELGRLLAPVPSQDRGLIYEAINDALKTAEGTPAAGFFLVFGSQLSEIIARDTDSGGKLFSKWLEGNNIPALGWLAGVLETDRTYLTKFNKDHVRDFKERIKEFAQPGSEMEPIVVRIRASMKSGGRAGNA